MNTYTDEELIKEVAKIDGKNIIAVSINRLCYKNKDNETVWFKPLYLTSYDAILPVVRKAINTEEAMINFISILEREIKQPKVAPHPHVKDFYAHYGSTPKQIADALVMAVNDQKYTFNRI